MEKINALIDKLQQLKNDGAGLSEIAYYTQLLYAELMCAKKTSGHERQERGVRKKVAVIMPGHAAPVMTMQHDTAVEEEEPPVAAPAAHQRETAAVREPEFAYAGNGMSGDHFHPAAVKSNTLFDGAPEKDHYHAATEAAAGREINEAIAEHTPSLNDKLKRENIELAAKLTDSVPVRDLSNAIDINNKFLFINELFRGDRDMFDRSVKTINECASLEEAEYWMGRELKIKLGWQDKNDTVQQFYQLVRKRFS